MCGYVDGQFLLLDRPGVFFVVERLFQPFVDPLALAAQVGHSDQFADDITFEAVDLKQFAHIHANVDHFGKDTETRCGAQSTSQFVGTVRYVSHRVVNGFGHGCGRDRYFFTTVGVVVGYVLDCLY